MFKPTPTSKESKIVRSWVTAITKINYIFLSNISKNMSSSEGKVRPIIILSDCFITDDSLFKSCCVALSNQTSIDDVKNTLYDSSIEI